jgi:SAM-dependent methyltransferase
LSKTAEQIREHYEVEKRLAAKLRTASRDERTKLYSGVYDELFSLIPFHSQIARKNDLEATRKYTALQLGFLKRFLTPQSVYAEIGAGDCSLAFEVCKYVKMVYAIDVSIAIAQALVQPPNFELKITDGITIPLAAGSVNIVYSDQLMEHLHPDDAAEQVQGIFKALVPGGKYICITPNRVNGPHDVSCFFDKVATGFHLREYSFQELKTLFLNAGFSTVNGYLGAKGLFIKLPASVLIGMEKMVSLLPHSLRRNNFIRLLLNSRVVAIK